MASQEGFKTWWLYNELNAIYARTCKNGVCVCVCVYVNKNSTPVHLNFNSKKIKDHHSPSRATSQEPLYCNCIIEDKEHR